MTRLTVVHEPAGDHHVCGPGWVWHERQENESVPSPPTGYVWRAPYDVPVGRVVECECGQTWVCVRIPEQINRRSVTCARNDWRKETRRERKRRERRARRDRTGGVDA